MTAEQLAAKMYEAWRKAMHDPFAHPAWGNLATEHRGAWIAAAKVAIEEREEAIDCFAAGVLA